MPTCALRDISARTRASSAFMLCSAEAVELVGWIICSCGGGTDCIASLHGGADGEAGVGIAA